MTKWMASCALVATMFLPVAASAQPLNQVQQKTSHNSYQKSEALLDQFLYHRLRSIELDIHFGKGGDWPPVPGNWFVYHTTLPFDSDTTCHRLDDCMDELRAFDNMVPNHEVVTVFVDVKDGWDGTHTPAGFDSQVRNGLGASNIFDPGDLLARCPGSSSLQQSVQSCGWPDLAELRGKFIFALTDGSAAPGTKLEFYQATGSGRAAFVAGKIETQDEIPLYDQVFFNLTDDKDSLALDIYVDGFISRQYGLNSSGAYSDAFTNQVHYLGTDQVNYHEDGWTVVHNENGWPFRCVHSDCSNRAAEERMIGVEVNSDDIWDSSDDFYFLYRQSTGGTPQWETAVGTVNSHVEDFAKGCLMARASTAENAAYFTVCRPADNKRLRVQYRDQTGENSSAVEIDIMPPDTIDQESLTQIALDLTSGDTCASGYGSQDGVNWSLIASRCFSSALDLQGVATSSHGNDPVKFLYVNLDRNGSPQNTGSFSRAAIGTVREASAFDGPFGDGGGCELDLRLAETVVTAGEPFEFGLKLLHNRPETADASFRVRVEDESGAVIVSRDSPSVIWEPGDERSFRYSLAVPPGQAPGLYTLRVSIDRMLQGVVLAERTFEVR